MPLRPSSNASQFSRVPMPSGLTSPTPVMTTRRSIVVHLCPGSLETWLRLLVGGDIGHGVLDRLDLLGVLVADLELEFLFERHHQLDLVERVGAQTINEGGCGGHFVLVDAQLLDDDPLDLLLDIHPS